MNDAEAVELLERLLHIRSLTGDEGEAARVLTDVMMSCGMKTQVDDAGNAIGSTVSDGKPELMFLGHIDTVPGDVPLKREAGCLYGRGAVDAKGPLAAALVAATRSGGPGITIVGAAGEEGPSHGARRLIERHPPDAVLIGEPGGADSIVLGYKGSMRAELHVEQAGAHTAGPESTACDIAFEAWGRVREACAGLGDGPRVFDNLTPTLLEAASSNDGLRQMVSLRASFRLPPSVSPPVAQERIHEAAAPALVSFADPDPAYVCRKDTPLVASLMRSIREEGMDPRFKYKSGTSDMNVVGPAWDRPMAAYGPGDSRLDHTPEEHIEIDEYLRGIRVLTHVFSDWSRQCS